MRARWDAASDERLLRAPRTFILVVPPPVVEHVAEHVAHLLGGRDRAGVIAKREHTAATTYRRVDGTRADDRDRAHAV